MLLLRKIWSFRSLPASERRCYLSALLLLPLVDISLRLFSWQRCQHWAERWAKRSQAAGRSLPAPRRIAWLVERAARHCPWPAAASRWPEVRPWGSGKPGACFGLGFNNHSYVD
jgi:hypothetical protein